jgi:two-component system phosphate regulon sensor histidine kinase PhoR
VKKEAPKLWGRPIAAVTLVSVSALVLWPILGAQGALVCYALFLLLLLGHHVVNLSHLYRWLGRHEHGPVPDGSGVWEDVFALLARLMRRQTQIESRLSAALDRFQQAGDALPEGVVVLDETDRIEWCNPRGEAYFGLTREDRGQQITYLIRNPQFVEYLEKGQFSEPLTLRVSRNESELTLSIQLVPYGDSDKLMLARDITHWERLEIMRRDFVGNVSHELRTPLTVLAGFLETLKDMKEPNPEMARRFLALMSEQTNRMSRLVEDLLTLSRLESAGNPLREEFVDVAELVRTLQRDAQALSNGRHHVHLRIDHTDGLRGSADELRSAFINLISNAVRYTPDGGNIEIAWSRQADAPTFSVRDTGIGIDPQDIPRLTERFYRVDRSRSRATGGTGLGLAIVKHVLQRHQAHLEISSDLGQGSIFACVFSASRSMRRPAASDHRAEVEELADR